MWITGLKCVTIPNALGVYFEASLLKGCTISKFHQWGLTCLGQGIHCAGKRRLCSSFTRRGLFHFLFALGTEGKSRVIAQEGRERQTKTVTNVGIFVLVS